MGFERCLLPRRNAELDAPGLELVGVDTLDEALAHLLG
jgi:hypothetical protein